MTTSTLPTTADLDELLYRSVVDDEFRSELLSDPAAFGIDPGRVAWPDPVEPQEQALLDVSLAGMDAYRCASTCSSGPFTFICDGSSK